MTFFKGVGRSLRDELIRLAGSLPLPLEITIPNLFTSSEFMAQRPLKPISLTSDALHATLHI